MIAPGPGTPEAVLERLCARYTDPRRLRSLAIIDEVCRLQREHGSLDFTLTTIGRLSKARHGPRKETIANPNGAAYRELIAAHEHAAAPPGSTRNAAQDDEARLLAGIKEPMQRARIRTALADARHWAEEAKRWRRKANALHAVANASATLMLEPGKVAGDLPTARFGRAARIELLPTEKAALAAALDARRLGKLALRIDARGRLLNEDGQALFPIGFTTMLAKVAVAVGVEFGDGSLVMSPTQVSDPQA